MRYRVLGRSELEVSVIGLGTYPWGGRWGKVFKQDEVNEIFAIAREGGINFVDTAECYGDHVAESLIGNAIKRERDKWIIATKFGHRRVDFNTQEQRWSVPEVKEQLEASLRALQTDYIDLYQFHSGSNEVFDNDELWTMLDKEVKAGKIRNLGISLSTRSREWRLHQTENALKVGASVIQVVYNYLDREAEETVFPICRRDNLGVIARVPLESGLLTGKYPPGYEFPDNDVRKKKYNRNTLYGILKSVEEIKRNELPEGVSMPVWAIAWVLKNPDVSATIPGCKNPDQLRENIKASELTL